MKPATQTRHIRQHKKRYWHNVNRMRNMGECIDIQIAKPSLRNITRANRFSPGEFNSLLQWAGDIFDVWCV
ncbi:MAG: hypothetical protein QM654_15030 [Dysgonamonadaceae bacterium]